MLLTLNCTKWMRPYFPCLILKCQSFLALFAKVLPHSGHGCLFVALTLALLTTAAFTGSRILPPWILDLCFDRWASEAKL